MDIFSDYFRLQYIYIDGMAEQRYNSIVASLERALDFVETEGFRDINLATAKIKLDRLHELWKGFNDSVLDRIETATLQVQADLQTKLNDIEDRWVAATAQFHQKISDLDIQPVLAPVAQKVMVELKDQPGKLTHTWGYFEGDLLKWNTFRDRFTKAVHEKDIPAVDKFGYLINSLRGLAAKIIGGYQVTMDNYEPAWTALCKEYGQKYKLAGAYLNKFYAMQKLKSPYTGEQLSNMAHATRELLRNMEQEGYVVAGWDIILVHSLHQRLPDDLQRQWILSLKDEQAPTVERMCQFLNDQANAVVPQPTVSTQHTDFKKPFTPPRPASGSGSAGQGVNANSKRFECESCSGNHATYLCPDFLALNYSGRKDFVQRRRLCANCLKRNHDSNRCPDSHRCKLPECQPNNAHNSTMCPHKVPNRPNMASVAVVSKSSASDKSTKTKQVQPGRRGRSASKCSGGSRYTDTD